MWYGKGPGVDRCGDVFKHANNAGTAKHGGVLVLAGDDHAAKSSSTAHQSDHILTACGIPVLYPSSVQEYLDFGLHAWAMSRYTGLWVSMKCVTDIVESGAVGRPRPGPRADRSCRPTSSCREGGLNIRWPDAVLDQEVADEQLQVVRRAGLCPRQQAQQDHLGQPASRRSASSPPASPISTRARRWPTSASTKQAARDIGLRLYKVGMTWPLEAGRRARIRAAAWTRSWWSKKSARSSNTQLKEELYNCRDDERPRVVGKFDDTGEWSNKHRTGHGDWLLPATYELNPAQIARAIAIAHLALLRRPSGRAARARNASPSSKPRKRC